MSIYNALDDALRAIRDGGNMLTDLLADMIDEHGVVAVCEALRGIMWRKAVGADTVVEGQLYARVAVALEGVV